MFRDNIEAMKAYVPGEQPAEGQTVIKLNTNENPYPPSPAVAKVLREFDPAELRAYPDPLAGRFRRAVAELLDVPAEWVLPGDGSDDLIVMIARAALGPGRPLVYPVPTFTYYFTQGQIEDARIVEVPSAEDFALPLEGLIEARGAVTFVSSPNSPTGLSASVDELEELAANLSGILVVDEAYVDFAETTALELAGRHENVIVLRTLSKSYSLAALRLGYGVACPTLLAGLLKTKSIYNVGALPAAVGAAALADQDYKNECVAKVKASRQALASDLEQMGFQVTPSQANFILVRPPGDRAERMYEALKARGILVRYYNQPRLDERLRITIGTEEENSALVRAVREML